MKYLVVPDSFKGSMSAQSVCNVFEEVLPGAVGMPIADGGEGSLEVLMRANKNLKAISMEVMDTYMQMKPCKYCIEGSTAYIETAEICGIDLNRTDILKSTSYGVGQALVDASKKGATTVYLFLGGTGSNDGGMGLMAGLGYAFLDKKGQILEPITQNLSRVATIQKPNHPLNFEKVYLVSDVTNALLGPLGATHVFGPQKGARPHLVDMIEEGMRHFADIMMLHSKQSMASQASSGAAGGIPFAVMHLFDYEVVSGIEFIADAIGLDAAIADADCVITGEGKIDAQSFYGKTIHHVTKRCQKFKKPYVLVCGKNDLERIDDPLCCGIFEMVDYALNLEESMHHGPQVLKRLINEGMMNSKS